MNIEIKDYLEISHKNYVEVFNRLMEAVNGKNYYSGFVGGNFEDGVEWELAISVAINEHIATIIPIWWTFTTRFGQDVLDNNFEFCVIKRMYEKNN